MKAYYDSSINPSSIALSKIFLSFEDCLAVKRDAFAQSLATCKINNLSPKEQMLCCSIVLAILNQYSAPLLKICTLISMLLSNIDCFLAAFYSCFEKEVGIKSSIKLSVRQ